MLANSDRLSACVPPWTSPTRIASRKKCIDVVMKYPRAVITVYTASPRKIPAFAPTLDASAPNANAAGTPMNCVNNSAVIIAPESSPMLSP